MKKFVIQTILLVAVALGGLAYTFNGGSNSFLGSNPSFSKQKIQVGEKMMDIELADTPEERERGLGGREKLGENTGMLFVFDENKSYQFWMKNMRFPLDFIFIRDGKVVDVLRDVPPPEANTPDSQLKIYQPIEPIDMLLEVNINFVDQNNIKVGDSVSVIEE